MPRYRVLLRGENFPLELESEEKLYGFYTTRWVWAADEYAAEQKAVERVKQDQHLVSQIVHNETEPMIYLEDIDVDTWFSFKKGKGYSFYPMDEGEEEDTKDAT